MMVYRSRRLVLCIQEHIHTFLAYLHLKCHNMECPCIERRDLLNHCILNLYISLTSYTFGLKAINNSAI